MRVAVVGKGGSGKSLVAGTMARLLARRGHRVLTLDSDPIPGLAISLGLGALDTPMLMDAAEKSPEGRWRLKKGVGAARAVQRYAALAPDGVRLLQFGKAGSEGLAPIMPSLNAFYQVLHRLARTNVLPDWTIVGDLPAGPRQTAFDWVPYADTLLLVCEPTWQSALTARRIARIARARPGIDVLLVANKVRDARDRARVEERMGEELAAAVPLDPAIGRADRKGRALIDEAPDSPAVRAIQALVDHLEKRRLDTQPSTPLEKAGTPS